MSASCEAITSKVDRAGDAPSFSTDEFAGGAGSLLSSIQDPSLLRTMPRSVLAKVADELREHLIGLGSRIGGHFAGSLGTVELTLALHAVFDTPHDRIVWDVGHQTYGHKLLTGRRDALERIKRSDGPAGFLRRCESPYDSFGAGHAGTSISAALGMAEAFSRIGSQQHAVAVIGDGSSTAGMSFEALNHAGQLKTNLSVVLNDNGMSIAPSVGGLHSTGDFRGYVEALGMRYLGPVDGHDLDCLLDAMEELRDSAGPSLLHVRTQKGHGYSPAEADPYGWHATGPFEISSGRSSAKKNATPSPMSWTAAFVEALERLAERDPRVVAITAAMPDGTGLDKFAKRFPERTYDVSIAEQHAVTFAAGLAAEGQRPVCAIYSTFLQRGFDQIVHDVALQDLPVTFAIDRAGLVGADGPTHHGAFDLSYLRAIPNLIIAAPRDRNQLQHLLATALESGHPFAIRFPRGPVVEAPMDPDPKPLPIGRAEILREGNDIALVAMGKCLPLAMSAAERLAEHGVEACVVDARFIKPLDADLLVEIATRTGRVITLEDHALAGGFGSAVLECLSERGVLVPVERRGLPDRFIDHGTADDQWREIGLDEESLFDAAIRLVQNIGSLEVAR